jgi:hypothetical protein
METFGQDHARGQAFDELSRAETRARLGVRGETSWIDPEVIDVLAKSIRLDVEAQNANAAGEYRQVARRSPMADSLWANWRFNPL